MHIGHWKLSTVESDTAGTLDTEQWRLDTGYKRLDAVAVYLNMDDHGLNPKHKSYI